jgi:succinate-acetate transporter protein
MGALRIGGANAHELREFAAATAATLGFSAFGGTCILLKLFH